MFQPGHHSVVSKHGVSRFGALLLAEVSDLEVRRALESLGAEPGDNLVPESWTKRNDPDSTAPDIRVEGSRVEVFVEAAGKRYRLGELIRSTPASELDLRYGGNEAWRSRFRSGCIVCNYSCPGGAIGNHALTIRDEANERVVFRLASDFPLADGERVRIVLHLE